MKSYIEIFPEFASLSIEGKEDYLLNVLSLDELNIFKEGLLLHVTAPKNDLLNPTIIFVDYIYKKRLSEIRNDKLDQLGI